MKRLLLFVLLLTAGFVTLHYSLGGDDPAGAKSTVPDPVAAPESAQDREGLHIQGRGSDIGVVLHGGMTIPRSRDVRVGNSIHHVPVYQLTFVDSAPVGDGLQQLDDVTLKLYDRGEHAGTLRSKTAFVELARDANGAPSLREDKEIELHEARLDTLPGARLVPVHLEIAVVRVRVRDEEIELHTPTQDEPVLLLVDGDHPGRMTGKGLQARLPKDQGGQLRRIDLDILHEPVLSTKDLEVRATGRLHYVEETGRGSALVTIDDDVRLLLQGTPQLGGLAGKSGDVEIRGDHLSAWIGRQQQTPGAVASSSKASWRLLRIDGAPAHATATGVDLRASRLMAVPGAEGQPYLLAATGGHAQLVQTAADGKVTTFVGRRIYNVRPGAHLGAMYRSFGFPGLGLGQLQRLQIGICEGESKVSGDGGVELQCQRGLWVFQIDPDDANGGTRVCGHGDVRIAQGEGKKRLLASGDHGLTLTRRSVQEQGVATSIETLLLGDDDDGSSQHYELRRGPLQLSGTGACSFERQQPATDGAEATVTVRLRSQLDSIHGSFGPDLGEMQGGRELDATLLGSAITALHLGGPHTRAVIKHGDETLTATAPSITQETPLVLRLDADAGQLAQLQRSVRGIAGVVDDATLTGPLLRIHRIDQRLLVLTAERVGDRRPHVCGEAAPAGRGKIAYGLDADDLQLLPFAVAPSAIDAHGNLLPPLAHAAFARAMRQPWLFADGDVGFHASEVGNGSITGHGEHLAVAQGSQSAMLIGNADTGSMATLLRTQPDGRVVNTRAPWLRLWREAGERITAFTTFPGQSRVHLPELELHAANGGNDALAHIWARCDGELQLLPDRVVFGGPVQAHGLLPDGSEDPTGIHIRGEHLDLRLDADRRPVRVVADGGVVFDYKQMHAEAQQVVLDTLDNGTHRCTVSDPRGAVLMVPGYEPMTVLRAEIDCESYRLQAWNASTRPPREAGADKRP